MEKIMEETHLCPKTKKKRWTNWMNPKRKPIQTNMSWESTHRPNGRYIPPVFSIISTICTRLRRYYLQNFAYVTVAVIEKIEICYRPLKKCPFSKSLQNTLKSCSRLYYDWFEDFRISWTDSENLNFAALFYDFGFQN